MSRDGTTDLVLGAMEESALDQRLQALSQPA